jgi:hypothetical protein
VNGFERLSEEAARLISEAESDGMILRALGSVGVRLHCHTSSSEMDQRARVPKDIDLMTRKTDRRDVRRFFEARGYAADRDMLVAMEGTRYLFRNPGSQIDIDVWVDVLDLCHRLDLSDRMGAGPSLSIEDLVLSKLQIVELTENDRHDLAAMFTVHEVGDDVSEAEVIDAGYISRVLAADWGFWRTATSNLEALAPALGPGAGTRVRFLLDRVEREPKTMKWKMRARVGERVQWWQDVDIPRDTY